MVRQGELVFVASLLVACSPDVDDPANFTMGSNSNSAGTTTSGGSDGATTEIAEGGNSATSTTGDNADTTAGADGASATTTTATTDGGQVGDCGNGIIDMGEQCDGADLQGFNCETLGLNGGTLACDPMMCTFDTSMCSSTTGGTSG